MTESPRKGIFWWLYKKRYNKAMKERKFEKRCPGPVDCFGDREVLFRKVLIPLAMGDDQKFPPKNGDYRNSLVVYEANGAIYIYSSDGLYTKLSVASGVNSVNGMSGDVNLFIPEKLSELENDTGFITKDVDDLTKYPKLSDLAQVAVSGSYLDLSNKPAINNGQLTINRNGSTVGSFKANQSQNTTVNIRVPVYTNELINNSQFVVDGNYIHTDNNFNDSWKNKLAHLADIQTIGSNLTLTNGRLDATGGVSPGDISSAIAAHNISPTAHSDIRGEISDINDLIPSQASTSNQLADKNFVNSSVQTATANFRGNWTDWADVPTVATGYPADYAGNKTPTVNDYLVVQDASDYTLETLEGTWRFKYTGKWDVDGKAGWHPEYQVNETPLTAAQLAALNSGITSGLVANIPTAPNIVITLGVDGGGNMVWSGANSIADVRNAFNNGGSLRVEAPILTEEIYNITEIWWKDSNHDTLIVQSVDNDAALIQIGIADDYSVEMDNVNLQEKLQAGANISINGNTISASVPSRTSQLINDGSDDTSTYVEADELGAVATSNSYNDLDDKPTIPAPITVDTELNNTSTNPVQNQALYDAIVGKEIVFSVYASAWSEPYGTNPYVTNAIVTLPAGSFTDNCMIELMIDDKFNDFAKYGFVLYGAEAASQRIWLTAMDKPTSTVYLKVKVYTYGN